MSVPSLASNRTNVFNLEVQDLTTELNDLSAYVYSLTPGGGVSQAEFNDLSSFTYTNINAIVPELTTISNDVDNLFALVYALDVSGISGFIILNDLSKEVFEISDRMLVIENDFISLSGSLNVRVTDISQGLDALTTTVGGFQGEINSISNELNDLSQYVYGLPSGDVTQAEFQTLSGFVRSNALLTSRTITNGTYVGTFNQSGSTASFQGITSLTGNIPTLQGITATYSNVVGTVALQTTSIVPPGPTPGADNIEITTTGSLICNTNTTEIVGNLQLDEEIVFCPQGSFSLVGSDLTTVGLEVDIPSSQADVNTILNVPNVMIMNCAGVPADSGTSTQMGTYLIKGGYRDSRNWMWLVPYGFSQTPIANMRIALDKAYFSTEQHPVRVPSWYDKSFYGLILSSKSKYMNEPTHTEAHIYAEICEKEKDKNVYGVYSSYDFIINNPDEDEEQIYSLLIPQKTFETKIGYSSSGGEGQLWVCNIGGKIEKGDYIHSSKIPGIGMKQVDDIKHNYTIFKSAFDCDFTNQVSIYPKHIIDSSGERQWRNPEDHSEGFKYEMTSYTSKVYNLKIYPTYYEIEDVLKYSYDFVSKYPELIGKTFKAMLLGGVYCN